MIVDANPIVSACLGSSKPLFTELIRLGTDLFVPEHQMREARLVTTALSEPRDVDLRSALAWIDRTFTIVPGRIYAGLETESRSRLKGAGAVSQNKDWPLIALALSSGEDIWSNDVDLFGTGLAVWNTHNIGRTVEHASSAGAFNDGNDEHA